MLSSTNRSNSRDNHIADYYITPVKDVKLFLEEFNKEVEIFVGGGINVLDPCAGGDDKHEMSYPMAINECFNNENLTIDTYDIREDSKAESILDYLKEDIGDSVHDVIITNPPFNQALPIIQKALNDVAEGGWVIMLLRLNFLETKSRKEFFDNYMPQYIYVHHKRMSFIEGKGTDSVAYAHFCWQKGNYPEFAKVKVI